MRLTISQASILDTSFILNFSIEGAKYFDECSFFIRRLVDENVLCVISNLTLDEFWYGLIRVSFMRDHPKDWLDRLRRLSKDYVDPVKRATRDLISFSNLIVTEVKTEFTFSALKYMEKYHLLPRDAMHLSTMLSLEIKNIATTDEDFAKVDGIKIYTCNPKCSVDSGVRF